MVRKVIALLICAVIVVAICDTSRAKAYSIYDEGSISSTYVTYFEDIVSGIPFTHNYVAFRSAQNEYIMITGDLNYNNGLFGLDGETAKEYRFYTTGNMNNQYYYAVSEIDSFDLRTNGRIIYSDLGDFPQLVSRGDKYEMLNTLLIIVLLLAFVIRVFFVNR